MDSQAPMGEKDISIHNLRQTSRHVEKLLQDPNYWEWFVSGEIVAHRFDYQKPRVDLAKTKKENQLAYLSVGQLEVLVFLSREERRRVYGANLTESHFALVDAYEDLYYPKIVVDRLNRGIEDFSLDTDIRLLLAERLKIDSLERRLNKSNLRGLRKKVVVGLGVVSLTIAGLLFVDRERREVVEEQPEPLVLSLADDEVVVFF